MCCPTFCSGNQYVAFPVVEHVSRNVCAFFCIGLLLLLYSLGR